MACRLQNWPSVEALPAALYLQRYMHKPSLRRANSAELPPLRALPPPITLSSLPSVNIDLDVDYQTEVAPFLGTCLVSICLLLPVLHFFCLYFFCLYFLCREFVCRASLGSCLLRSHESQVLSHKTWWDKRWSQHDCTAVSMVDVDSSSPYEVSAQVVTGSQRKAAKHKLQLSWERLHAHCTAGGGGKKGGGGEGGGEGGGGGGRGWMSQSI